MTQTATPEDNRSAARGGLVTAACTIAYPQLDLAAATTGLAARFDAVELTFDYGVSLPPRAGLIEELVALREEHGLRYSVHLPLSIGLASPNPALRAASLDTLVKVFTLCQPLEPEAWILHITPLFAIDRSITSRERASARRDQAVADADAALAELLGRVAVPSRRIAVENLNYPFEFVDELLERHDLGVCFDVGHLLLRHGSPQAFVRRYADRLAHVHLHDVVDGLDHRALGDPAGTLDVSALWQALTQIDYQGLVTLEVFEDAHITQSLTAVQRFLNDTGRRSPNSEDRRSTGTGLSPGAPSPAAGGAPVVRADEPPLRVTGQVSPSPRVHYLLHEFELAPGAAGLTVTLRYHKERLCQIFLAVCDPQEYRGTRMNPSGYGDIALELRFGEQEAGPGARPGPLRPGRWQVLIDIERTIETADYELEILAESATEPAGTDEPEHALSNASGGTSAIRGPGWYRGELHAHSWHSDGKVPVGQVVEAARAYGLDFLALTDHFTNAGWRELTALGDGDLAVLRGLELTGHSGHANLHGLDRWVNIYADGPARDTSGREVWFGPGIPNHWDVNGVARAVREQGGLFCVNHPFSGDLGWRYHEFDWDLADLLEVYHHLEGAHNALQLGLWDEHLRQGRRIVGVAGTDSHHPREGHHRLGQCFTYVHAPELSEAGIIAGLRAGRAYVSLGPRLDHWAQGTDGRRIEMGGAVTRGEAVTFHVTFSELRYPAQLYLLKNGFFHDAVAVEPTAAGETHEVLLMDTPTAPGYYRLELYAAQPHELRPYRQTGALLLLSNPIFVS